MLKKADQLAAAYQAVVMTVAPTGVHMLDRCIRPLTQVYIRMFRPAGYIAG